MVVNAEDYGMVTGPDANLLVTMETALEGCQLVIRNPQNGASVSIDFDMMDQNNNYIKTKYACI